MKQPEELINAYLDDEMTPEEEQEFLDWLRQDSEHIRAFARAMQQHIVTHDYLSEVAVEKEQSAIASKRTIGILQFRRFAIPLSVAAALAVIFGGANYWTRLQTTAVITEVKGAAVVARNGADLSAQIGMKIRPSDRLSVAPASQMMLRYHDNSTITLAADSSASLLQHATAKRLRMERGRMEAQVSAQYAGNPMIVYTPNAAAQAIGTRFALNCSSGRSELEVTGGSVRFMRLVDNRSVNVGSTSYAVVAETAPLVSRPMADRAKPEVLIDETFVKSYSRGWVFTNVTAACGIVNRAGRPISILRLVPTKAGMPLLAKLAFSADAGSYTGDFDFFIEKSSDNNPRFRTGIVTANDENVETIGSSVMPTNAPQPRIGLEQGRWYHYHVEMHNRFEGNRKIGRYESYLGTDKMFDTRVDDFPCVIYVRTVDTVLYIANVKMTRTAEPVTQP